MFSLHLFHFIGDSTYQLSDLHCCQMPYIRRGTKPIHCSNHVSSCMPDFAWSQLLIAYRYAATLPPHLLTVGNRYHRPPPSHNPRIVISAGRHMIAPICMRFLPMELSSSPRKRKDAPISREPMIPRTMTTGIILEPIKRIELSLLLMQVCSLYTIWADLVHYLYSPMNQG